MPDWQMHKGDALAVLRDLPDASVDAVVTDPPYSSGGMMRGDRQASTETKYSLGKAWADRSGVISKPATTYEGFTGDNRDQRSYAYWFALWAGECRRIAKPGATFLTFTDWRQLPTTTDAVQAAGWVWRAIAVWDKGIGRPMKGRFRNHIEYLVWATNGPLTDPQDVYLSSIFRHTPPTAGKRIHLTEKPVPLLEELMALVPAGGVVLDPFAGSGSTGLAALNTGRDFIGVEMTDHYHEVATTRLTEAANVLRLPA